MRMTSFLFGVLSLAAASGAALAAPSGPTLQDKQQAACYDDVQRLCGDALPDVDKATACMKDKRPQVSAKCSAMWDVKK
jgi:hypothetical protein